MAALVRPRVRPSGWWYLAAVVGFVVGLVLAVLTLVGGFRSAEEAGFSANLAGPGEEQLLTIDEPGAYTVAYTGPLVVFSTRDQEELVGALAVSIVPVDGGAPLVLAPYDGLNDLEQDGAQYVPLQTVRFTEAGDYTFTSSPMARLDSEKSRLVVSQSPFRKLREAAVRSVLIATVAAFLAGLSMVILGVTRGRAKRTARMVAVPPPAAWPPAPGWGR